MKRFLAAALAASMVLMTAGCAGGTTSESSADSGSATSAPATESKPVEESSAPSESTSEDASTEDTSSDATSSEDAPSEDASSEIDYSTLTEEEIYDLMIERSLITTGDTTRMSNVLKRAQNGETITAAYIGGSITEGYHDGLTLKEDEKWAKMSTTYLAEQFPDATFNYVNAGISGTPSVLGNVRLERDVLSSDPDIVFVEFAVNDGGETIYKNAYESLVRTLLADERDIAVVLLFTIVENGHTCQPHMTQIGERYDLPMISLPDSIWVEMQEGRMIWDDYSGDGSHPHVEGGKMIRDMVIHYYENVIPEIDANAGDVDNTLPEPVFSGDYMDMHYFDSEEFKPELVGFAEENTHGSFQHGWGFKGDTGASMKFDITCKKLAMVYKENNSKAFGDAEIYVDGKLVKTVSSNTASGWNNPVTTYIIDEDASAAHTVEIKVAEGTKCYFGILAFGSNE